MVREAWFKIAGLKDPLTDARLLSGDLVPNIDMRSDIQKWQVAEKQSNFSESSQKYIVTKGECVSIPTDSLKNNVMKYMVYVDFFISGLFPFSIMILCNIIIIWKLIENKKKRSCTSFN